MPTPHHEGKLIGGQMMNYEANPFRDYESITIDEQKDQTSSLLNLVTEEQLQGILLQQKNLKASTT